MQKQTVVNNIDKLLKNRNSCSGFFILQLANSFYTLIECLWVIVFE